MPLSKSFTLIELLVVMAIIGLMTSIIIVNYSGQKTKDLEEQAVLQFVSDLRRAQNMAMSVYDCGGVQDKYGIYDITDGNNKYKITCYTQEFELPVNISGDNIYFLPIDANFGRTTIETENAPRQVRFPTETINITKEGQITW